ncbi:hypothetical protein HRbin40_02044 [bacterium HR40]|nr:hypothetical protein HRbin40_02044 [bacterium HR40]
MAFCIAAGPLAAATLPAFPERLRIDRLRLAGDGWHTGTFALAADLLRRGAGGFEMTGRLTLGDAELATFRFGREDHSPYIRIETPTLGIGSRGVPAEQLFAPLPKPLRTLSGLLEAGLVLAPSASPESRAWLVLRDGAAEVDGVRLAGIETRLSFDSLNPLRSLPGQSLRVHRIVVGSSEGSLEALFDLGEGTRLAVRQAALALWGGRIELQPVALDLGHPDGTLVADIAAIDLREIAAVFGNGRLRAEGVLDGTARIRLTLPQGWVAEAVQLRARSAGTLGWSGELPATSDPRLALVRDLLQDFHYRRLEARLDGPLAGALALRVTLEGANPAVLGGYPVALDLRFEGPLGRVLLQGVAGDPLPTGLGERLWRSLR